MATYYVKVKPKKELKFPTPKTTTQYDQPIGPQKPEVPKKITVGQKIFSYAKHAGSTISHYGKVGVKAYKERTEYIATQRKKSPTSKNVERVSKGGMFDDMFGGSSSQTTTRSKTRSRPKRVRYVDYDDYEEYEPRERRHRVYRQKAHKKKSTTRKQKPIIGKDFFDPLRL